MSDGAEVAVNRWIPDDKDGIKGVVQLSHGMLEHSLRYDRLGCILAEHGYVFSAHDHRGHGKTASNAQQKGTGMFGKLADKDGFSRVVSDVDEIIERLKGDYPGRKVVLLGHSFGSFISQAYIERHGEKLAGCILCGSAGPDNGRVRLAKFITGVMRLFHRPEYKSRRLQNIVYSGYLKRIPDAKNEFAWVSANPVNVEMYMNDSWCGGVATISFYKDLMDGLLAIHKPAAMRRIPQSLPVFLIAGADDPVGGYGRTLEKLAGIYRKNGMHSVSLKLYAGDRHELFNEQDSDSVVEDVLRWIEESVLKG
ncbi:MAG: lysophospholipase [Treponemataceae bacterium]|nr:lysophospholipase [Treponemataceae bacterium]